jgi:hypothetical protein
VDARGQALSNESLGRKGHSVKEGSYRRNEDVVKVGSGIVGIAYDDIMHLSLVSLAKQNLEIVSPAFDCAPFSGDIKF